MNRATVADIAAALGISEQAVRKRAKDKGWQPNGKQGKGYTFDPDTLPIPGDEQRKINAYLLDRAIAALPEPVCQLPAVRQETLPALAAPSSLPSPAQLKGWQRRCMEARLALLQMVDQLAVAGVERAIKAVVSQAAANLLPGHIQALIPSANARGGKNGGRTLSARSIYRWRADLAAAEGNPVALAPVDQKDDPRLPAERRKGAPAWAPAFLKFWEKGQNSPLTDVLEEMKKHLTPGATMPSYDQARRYLGKLGVIELNKGRMTGGELDTLKPHRRRDTSDMLPGDAYTADGHCFDAEVAHPFHGRPFRPEITPVLDIATRRAVGWSVDLAESGLAVLDALRVACERFGPPAIFYTDNGPGFKNEMLTAPGRGILARLGIHPEYSRPRNAKAHGISERAHRTILVKAARELCTYIGASMDPDTKKQVFKLTRKAVKNPELPTPLIEWDDFIAHVNEAIEAYNDRPHSALPAVRDPQTRKRVHLSPNQAWHLGMQQMLQEIPAEQVLRPANETADLYHPMVERTVHNGQIQLGKKRDGRVKYYYSADLKEYHGRRVHVAFSPSDPGQVWVRSIEDERLLAVAKLDGNSSPYFALSHIEEKRHERGKSRLKRLELQAQEVRLEIAGPASVLVEPSAAATEAQRRIEWEMAQEAPAPAPVKAGSAQGNYARWKDLEVRRLGGMPIGAADEAFFKSFSQTAEWRAMRAMEEDFGEFYAIAK